MRKVLVIAFILIAASSQAQFNKYFHQKSLRVNFEHAGNHETEHYFLNNLEEEKYWAGSQKNLIDTPELWESFL